MTSIFFRSMCKNNNNKKIARFGFCDIQINQGLGKGYQAQLSASADDSFQDLDILDITKTSSNNCLLTCQHNYLLKITHFTM